MNEWESNQPCPPPPNAACRFSMRSRSINSVASAGLELSSRRCFMAAFSFICRSASWAAVSVEPGCGVGGGRHGSCLILWTVEAECLYGCCSEEVDDCCRWWWWCCLWVRVCRWGMRKIKSVRAQEFRVRLRRLISLCVKSKTFLYGSEMHCKQDSGLAFFRSLFLDTPPWGVQAQPRDYQRGTLTL